MYSSNSAPQLQTIHDLLYYIETTDRELEKLNYLTTRLSDLALLMIGLRYEQCIELQRDFDDTYRQIKEIRENERTTQNRQTNN
jgi:hypothetical protein